jgi:hypothetical protein
MKQLLFFILLSLPAIFLAQSDLVLETNTLIKRMDAQLNNNTFEQTMYFSWSPSEIEIADPNAEIPKMTFRYLVMPEGFGVKEIQFTGNDGKFEMKYYCFNGTPFFAFLSGEGQECINRYKVYYEQTQLVTCLRQTNACNRTSMSAFLELKDEVEMMEELTGFAQFAALADAYVIENSH